MRALANSVYALDDEIIFNVLDQVDYDSKTGQIALTGHLDTNYRTTGIPYLEYLATLLDNPSPEFSLEWTAESNRRVDDFRRQTGSDAELKKLAREWGTWMDAAGHVTPAGRVIMPMFGISPPVDSMGDPWQKMDRYQIISSVIAAAGNKKGALVVDAYRLIHQTLPNISKEALISLLNATGTYELIERLYAQLRQGKLTQAQLDLQMYRAICQGLDRAFNLSNQPVTQFFDRSIRQGKSVGDSYDAATVVEFDRQLRGVFETSLRTLWRSKPEIQIPLSVASPSLRETLIVIPHYFGVEKQSLLAKLLFDIDYVSKRFVDSPELAADIPGYQTLFTFRRTHPLAFRKSLDISGERFWTSIERIDASRSTDGNVLAFRDVKMHFNIREHRADGRDLPIQQLGEYEKLLSSLYEGFAREYPVFHELREAAKLAYAAQWLKTKSPEPRMPASGRSVWEGPASVPGFMFVTWSPIGEDVITWSAVGGVSLRVSVPAVPPAVCVKNCEDNIPTDPQLKPVKETAYTSGMLDLVQGGGVNRLPAANSIGLYLKLPRLGANAAAAQTPVRDKQLPIIKCLLGQAAGLSGLGTFTRPPTIDDENTLAVAIMNSAYDGAGKFNTDCEMRVDQAIQTDLAVRGQLESKIPAVNHAVDQKLDELIKKSNEASVAFKSVNTRLLQELKGCDRAGNKTQCQDDVLNRSKADLAKAADARRTAQRECNSAEQAQQAVKQVCYQLGAGPRRCEPATSEPGQANSPSKC